ncbi:MAG TPA: hydroxyacid dehydrogenase [Acidobacteriaceae bacterium]|jgi:D-3-phosphoglycerate dehydrogenase/(S)-sulfolactate dehydrogenase
MPDILISENIRGASVDALAKHFDVLIMPELWRDPAALAERIAGVRALIIRNQTQITAELLRNANDLIVLGRAGVGLDNVDLDACDKTGVIVSSTPEQSTISVAELAIGLMLSLARHIPAADADTRQGNWNRQRFFGNELYGKTFGIIGAGKIGLATARRALAFGMKILAHDPFVSRDNVFLAELNAELVPLEDLLSRADVISCHLPATRETTHILDAAAFACMKPTALFINTSRGEVVDEQALIDALKSNKIGGAALDVRETEPPVAGELERLPNVLLMPHIAALTHEAQARVTRAICDDVTRVLEGKPPLNAVLRPQTSKQRSR